MKHPLLFAVLYAWPAIASPEKATFDLVRYTPPAPWKNTAWKMDDTNRDRVSYTNTDLEKRTYCQIFIVRSTISKGDVSSDFASEWKEIVVNSYKVTEPAQVTDTAEENGWKAKAGVATFAFDNGTSIAMLTTLSGYNRAVSIVAVTSSQDYLRSIQDLLASVEMKKPAPSAATVAKPAAHSATKETAKPAALQGYMDYNPFTQSWTWKVRYPPPQK